MKVALIGASGNVGSKILSEALDRGHDVTGIVRNPGQLTPRPGMTARRGDVNDTAGLAALLSGHEAVISSVRFLSMGARMLLAAIGSARVNRLLVVGGAGSLEVAPGIQLVDTPDFPPEYKSEALAGCDFLAVLREERSLDWTFLSPSALFVSGTRTGIFRLGKERLLTASDGRSWISQEDFAIALIDELETPRHVRERFTVGY
jgi:putative NADH-flavin reductase